MLYELLARFLTFSDPSEYEEYFEDTNYKTFILDERIWNRHAFQRPDIGYYRELQVCFQQLREEQAAALMFDTNELLAKCNEYHFKNMDLERELALERAKVAVLTEQLEDARKYQTQAGRKVELGINTAAVGNQAQERDADNRFTNEDGITTIQKQKLALIMYTKGYTFEDIAESLNIGSGSARSYVSTAKKYCHTRFEGDDTVFFWEDKYNLPEHEVDSSVISVKTPLNAVKSPLKSHLNEPINDLLKAM